MQQPFTFDQARMASIDASRTQEAAEQELAAANRAYAQAEEAYRKALALEMWRLRHDEGIAWSTLSDLARGDEQVAAAKRARDDAEGNREIASHAVYRRSADRRDVERFIQWSQARDLAENGGRNIPSPDLTPIGTRRAA